MISSISSVEIINVCFAKSERGDANILECSDPKIFLCIHAPAADNAAVNLNGI